MDYLKEAQMFARHLDGDFSSEVGAHNAQKAIACALITIAKELRVMNARHEWPDDGIEVVPLDSVKEQPTAEDYDLPY